MVPGRLPVSFTVPRVSVVLSLILITRMGHDGHGMMNMADLRIFKGGNSSRAFCCHWCHWPQAKAWLFTTARNQLNRLKPTMANPYKSYIPSKEYALPFIMYCQKDAIRSSPSFTHQNWWSKHDRILQVTFLHPLSFLLFCFPPPDSPDSPDSPESRFFRTKVPLQTNEVSREIDQVTQTADHHRDHLGDAAVILSMRRSRSTGRVVVLVEPVHQVHQVHQVHHSQQVHVTSDILWHMIWNIIG